MDSGPGNRNLCRQEWGKTIQPRRYLPKGGLSAMGLRRPSLPAVTWEQNQKRLARPSNKDRDPNSGPSSMLVEPHLPTGTGVSYQPVFQGIWRSDRRAAWAQSATDERISTGCKCDRRPNTAGSKDSRAWRFRVRHCNAAPTGRSRHEMISLSRQSGWVSVRSGPTENGIVGLLG